MRELTLDEKLDALATRTDNMQRIASSWYATARISDDRDKANAQSQAALAARKARWLYGLLSEG